MKKKRIVLGLLITYLSIISCSLQSYAASTPASVHILAGQWSGSMTLGPKEYPISLWFDDGTPMTGRIQLVGLTTDNNPLTDISVTNDVVSFALASRPPQRFSGAIQGETIEGTIDIGGMTETFTIQKIAP